MNAIRDAEPASADCANSADCAANGPLTPPTQEAAPRIVTGQLFRVRAANAWRLTTEPPPPEPEPVRRPARVARMLALAHHLERAIHAGRVADRAALARELGLTRARISQFLDLLLLAPDIQETLLFAEAIDGREPISMRALRSLALIPTWQAQRLAWRRAHPNLA